MSIDKATENEDLITIDEAVAMAVNLHHAGRVSESEALYESILTVEPEQPEALHFLGLMSFQNNDIPKAIDLLSKSLHSRPDYTDARNNLGNIYRITGDYSTAETCYRQVVDESPTHPQAWNNLGGVLLSQRNFSGSLECYNKACDQAPDSADFHYNRGHALHNCQQWQEAEAAYRRAIELNPEHAAAFRELASILQSQERTDEAIQCFQQSAELDALRGEVHCAHGDALRSRGLLPDALLAYRRAILRDPGYCRAYEHAAHALSCLDRLEEADEMVRTWLKLEPENATAKHMLASINPDSSVSRAADDYVEKHFDEFAKHFDSRLAVLEYKAPELLCNLAISSKAVRSDRQSRILDAGCGTGLCGPLLKPYADTMIGIDLSTGMLEGARERGDHYSELVHAEITEYLLTTTQVFDLIISADTLVYFGDLADVVGASARCLADTGWLLFSVEKLDNENTDDPYRLNPNGRFSHQYEYLQQTLIESGFRIECIQDAILRKELGNPVNGYLVLGQKN